MNRIRTPHERSSRWSATAVRGVTITLLVATLVIPALAFEDQDVGSETIAPPPTGTHVALHSAVAPAADPDQGHRLTPAARSRTGNAGAAAGDADCFMFGGAGESFSGIARMRGNTYTVSSQFELTGIMMELDFSGTVELYFYVLESPTLDGTYSVLSETIVSTSGVGQAFYASGSLSVPLEPNMFYGIGVAWGDQSVTYFRDVVSQPRSWELGTVEDGLQHGGAPPYTSLDYGHTPGFEYSMDLCMVPTSCHRFGGDDQSFSGTARLRGNTYTVSEPQVVTEIQMELDFTDTADLYYYVLESPTLGGTYSVLSETIMSTPGVGQAFYSSGPMSVLLDPSMFYGIGVAWGAESVGYLRDTISLPRSWELGTVEDGMQHGGAPPYTTLEYGHTSGFEYSMELCLHPPGCYLFGGADTLFAGPSRLRGHTYTVASSEHMNEIRMQLDFTGPADLYYYVLESPEFDQIYDVIFETLVPTVGTGLALYSSGPLSVTLEPNMFYGIGVSWGPETVGYRRTPSILPRPWVLGMVMSRMTSNNPPPHSSPVLIGQDTDFEYWMELCFGPPTTAIPADSGVGAAIALPGFVVVRPNPFNPATTFEYSLPHRGRATLRLHDPAGRLVRTLVDGPMDGGAHSVRWDGADAAGRQVPSAIYFYRLQLDGIRVDSGKAVVIK